MDDASRLAVIDAVLAPIRLPPWCNRSDLVLVALKELDSEAASGARRQVPWLRQSIRRWLNQPEPGTTVLSDRQSRDRRQAEVVIDRLRVVLAREPTRADVSRALGRPLRAHDAPGAGRVVLTDDGSVPDLADHEQPPDVLEDLAEELRRRLTALPARQRWVFVRHIGFGARQSEIAVELGVSRTTVRKLFGAACEQLGLPSGWRHPDADRLRVLLDRST